MLNEQKYFEHYLNKKHDDLIDYVFLMNTL